MTTWLQSWSRCPRPGSLLDTIVATEVPSGPMDLLRYLPTASQPQHLPAAARQALAIRPACAVATPQLLHVANGSGSRPLRPGAPAPSNSLAAALPKVARPDQQGAPCLSRTPVDKQLPNRPAHMGRAVIPRLPPEELSLPVAARPAPLSQTSSFTLHGSRSSWQPKSWSRTPSVEKQTPSVPTSSPSSPTEARL